MVVIIVAYCNESSVNVGFCSYCIVVAYVIFNTKLKPLVKPYGIAELNLFLYA